MNTFKDVLQWVRKISQTKFPDYTFELIPTSSYYKISLMYQYGDLCILRLANSGTGYWFSFNSYPGIDKNDPLFSRVDNKNKNHWKINIRRLDEIAAFKDTILESIQHQSSTYEVDKYPYHLSNGPVLKPHGSGIEVNLNIK